MTKNSHSALVFLPKDTMFSGRCNSFTELVQQKQNTHLPTPLVSHQKKKEIQYKSWGKLL